MREDVEKPERDRPCVCYDLRDRRQRGALSGETGGGGGGWEGMRVR